MFFSFSHVQSLSDVVKCRVAKTCKYFYHHSSDQVLHWSYLKCVSAISDWQQRWFICMGPRHSPKECLPAPEWCCWQCKTVAQPPIALLHPLRWETVLFFFLAEAGTSVSENILVTNFKQRSASSFSRPFIDGVLKILCDGSQRQEECLQGDWE